MKVICLACLALVLVGVSKAKAQVPHRDEKDKNMFAENECFAKGGLGIINPNLYIVLRSETNELQLPGLEKWNGQSASASEVELVFEGKVWRPDALPHGFDLSKSILISFEVDKVRFFDFTKETGGYYKRSK